MPRKYVRKEGVVPRCIEWTENDLMLAFEDIEKGDKGINEIARSRGIPCRTLRRRFMKRRTEKRTLGKHPLLGFENEARLVNHILKLGEAGFPPNRQSIRLLAYNFAENLGLNHNFDRETEMAGNAWFNSFMERHPVLSIRQAEGLSMARAKGLNREEVTDFFPLLTKTLTENNLLDMPERIFNMDESGVQLNNKPGKVVAKKGVRTVKQVTSGEKGETITVVGSKMGRRKEKYYTLKKNSSRFQKQGINEKQRNVSVKAPRSLAVLCKQVIIKHKLLPEKKRFAPPEDFFVVGGKPLRKRSVKPPPEAIIETKRKKGNTPSQRGKKKQSKPRGRPRKDKVEELYSTIHSQTVRKIKEENELILDQPSEADPLDEDNEEHFTVVIKEENVDVEYEQNPAIVLVPQATEHGLVINSHFDQMPVPGPSTPRDLHTMTVIMDEYQVFANRIAEQLRALPVNRALLLELDIQSMIDNEKQLLTHET